MNKADMVKELSSRLGCTQTESLHIINTWQEVISDNLSQGNNIVLQGFGSFARWQQTERLGRNPRTGKSCMIPSRVSVKFKPGKFLLQWLNKK